MRSRTRSRTMLPFIGALALATACGDTSQLDSAFGPNSVPDGTIVLERSRFEGDAGDTASLRAFVLDRRGRRFHVEELSWESADSSIAVVDSAGQLFLVQPGETQLHVDYKGTRLTASARASNRVTIAKVDIYPEPLSLTIGDEREMGLYIRYSSGLAIRNKLGVNWSSSDPSVARVNGWGRVSALKAGTSTVIGKRGKYADTVTVTVSANQESQAAPTLSIAPDTGQVRIGETFSFSTALSSGQKNPSGVSWTITDPTVASISSSGALTGKKEGYTTVRAARDGKSVTAALRVVAAPKEPNEPDDSTEEPNSGEQKEDQSNGSNGGSNTPPVSSPPPTSPSGGVARPAELPRVFLDTRYPQLNGRKIRVPTGGNLQRAIDEANPGDEILLPPGSVFSGHIRLKPKSGSAPIVIRTEVDLPPEGTRMTPAIARQLRLAKITSSEYGPVLRTDGLASNYRIVGLEITVDPSRTDNYSIVRFGAVEGSLQRTLADIPTNLTIDRSYIHGHPSLHVRRCIELQSKSSAVVDSYVSECHAKGADAQAIAGWNGPGPYKIVNNYLEGSGENIMFGGAGPTVQNMIPSDIEIRRNHFFKPLEWRTSRRWTVKNSFEVKAGRRILLEGNVFENNWTDGQVGTAIVLKSVGGFGWAETSDITFRYNIIRNVGGVFSLSARPEEPNAIPASRITIVHNLIYDIGAASSFGQGSGTGRFVTMSNELDDVTIDNNTVVSTVRSVLFVGGRPPSKRFQMRNNIVEGEITSDAGHSPWSVALGVHTASRVVEGNIFVTSRAGTRPENNSYFISTAQLGFANHASSDYRLSSSSGIRAAGTGRTAPGANVDAVAEATRGVVK